MYNEGKEHKVLHLAHGWVKPCTHSSYAAARTAAVAPASGLAGFNGLITAISLCQNGEEGKGDHKSEDDLRDELHDYNGRVMLKSPTNLRLPATQI